MKGFTRDHKFVPMTDYKKVTRKSRDTKEKTKGVRLKRLTQVQVNQIKQDVLPLDKHAVMMMEFRQGQARRDRFATPLWNSMTQAERLRALNKAGVDERAMGLKLKSREELSKLPYIELPHYAKTDLGFHFFNLNREGRVRLKRNFAPEQFIEFQRNNPLQARVNKTVIKQSLNDIQNMNHNADLILDKDARAVIRNDIERVEEQLQMVYNNSDRRKLELLITLALDSISQLQRKPSIFKSTNDFTRLQNIDRRLELMKGNIDQSGAFRFGINDEALLSGSTKFREGMRDVINKKERS